MVTRWLHAVVSIYLYTGRTREISPAMADSHHLTSDRLYHALAFRHVHR
jgi:hypothetical protein